MAGEFRNGPISTAGLPRLDDEDFVGVDPRHLRPWLATLAVVGIGLVGVTAMLAMAAERTWIPLVIGTVLLAIVLALAALTILERRRLAYQLRDHDISYRSGAIGRRVATIPFARIQHVTVTRGPLERAMGLATLGVASAGPDLSIPGLTPDDAERIKQFVVARSEAIDQDADDARREHGPLTEPHPSPGSPIERTALPPPSSADPGSTDQWSTTHSPTTPSPTAPPSPAPSATSPGPTTPSAAPTDPNSPS